MLGDAGDIWIGGLLGSAVAMAAVLIFCWLNTRSGRHDKPDPT